MQPEQNQPYSYGAPVQPDRGRTKRIIIGVTGLVVFIFIVIVVVIFIFSGPDHRQALGSITAKQQEIARVSELGLKSKRAAQSTKNFAANSQVSAAGHVAALARLVDDKHGQPLDGLIIESAENSSIDTTLETAEQNSNIDAKFIEIIKALLKDSNEAIKAQADLIEDQETLELLNQVFIDNNLLLESI